MTIFTIAAANYYAKAVQLAHSVRCCRADARLVLYLLERPEPVPTVVSQSFDQILFVEALSHDRLDDFLFRRSAFEAACSIKARAFTNLQLRFPKENEFVYLDPDIEVFSPFDELTSAFEVGSIAVTPHLLMAEAAPEVTGPIIFNLLQGGVFNLGFLAVRRSGDSDRFLLWLRDRSEAWGFDDRANGLFCDQKWIDFAIPFTRFSCLNYRGYNVAFWNVLCRPITIEKKRYLAGGEPLRFIHFSNVSDDERTRQFLDKVPRTNKIHGLVRRYIEEVKHLSCDLPVNREWSYDFYRSGERISSEARGLYRANVEIRQCFRDPFGASNQQLTEAHSKQSI